MGEVDPISVYERLLDDDELKDVNIEFSDGALRAHACVLSAASEAVKGILRNGTARESRALTWKEHDLKVGRFFLRLLYTGCVEERDWAEPVSAAVAGDSGGVASIASVASVASASEAGIARATGPTLTLAAPGRQVTASVPASAVMTFQDGMRVRLQRDTNALAHGGSCRFIAAGTVGTVSGGGKSVVWPLPSGGPSQGTVSLESLRGNLEAVDSRPPLVLLTGAIAIAKVYQFPSMLGALTASIKKRLSVQTFDEICRSAIKDDIQVLRYHCMRFADSESKEARELRELYSEGRLSPEVTHELDGLCRQEAGRPKRRRTL